MDLRWNCKSYKPECDANTECKDCSEFEPKERLSAGVGSYAPTGHIILPSKLSNWRPEGWKPDYTVTILETVDSGDLAHYTNVIIKSAFEAGADAMLGAVSEEIEKVENPYVPIRSGTSDADRANTFESCRQKILALLK